MPSKSARQHRFMQAIAHGWKPDKGQAPPVAVAKEFVAADKLHRVRFKNLKGRPRKVAT